MSTNTGQNKFWAFIQVEKQQWRVHLFYTLILSNEWETYKPAHSVIIGYDLKMIRPLSESVNQFDDSSKFETIFFVIQQKGLKWNSNFRMSSHKEKKQ